MRQKQEHEENVGWTPALTRPGWKTPGMAIDVFTAFDQSGRWEPLTAEYYAAHAEDEFVLQNFWAAPAPAEPRKLVH